MGGVRETASKQINVAFDGLKFAQKLYSINKFDLLPQITGRFQATLLLMSIDQKSHRVMET